MLDQRARQRASAITSDQAQPPEALVVSIVPVLSTGIMRGRSASACVDACRILHYGYAQFGIRPELRAAELTVTAGDGRTVVRGTLEPYRDGAKGETSILPAAGKGS